jgi:hypothetical protein
MSADALITEARAVSKRIAPARITVTFDWFGLTVYATPLDAIRPVTVIYHGDDTIAAQAAIRKAYPETEAA